MGGPPVGRYQPPDQRTPVIFLGLHASTLISLQLLLSWVLRRRRLEATASGLGPPARPLSCGAWHYPKAAWWTDELHDTP